MLQNITSVRGFKCWGAHTGVKSMKRDLAIIYSEVPASVGCTFTQNRIVAEPVKISREHIQNGKAQVIVCNAGNANACTGEQGYQGAMAMVEAIARSLKVEKNDVIVASTGIIGEPFPTEKVVSGIEDTAEKLTDDPRSGSFAASAILTTDTFPKEGFRTFLLDGKDIHMAGIAKGSGMIHPNMATMLGFIVCDLAIESSLLQEAVKECVDQSFNMITVDGDTSTNDMVAVMCNGLAKNELIDSKDHPSFKTFKNELLEMMMHLAQLIVSDGEGASKVIEYQVKNAQTVTDARKLARSISNSNLVKTAMFGRDPNWGRIICAAGNAGPEFEFKDVDLSIGDQEGLVKVLEKGVPLEIDRGFMKKLLRESHIRICLDLNSGTCEAKAWGADLTTDYVMFNSVYTT